MAGARSGRVSDYRANIWLTALAGGSLYMALFASDPYAAGSPTAVEITGPGYARAIPTWSISGRVMTCTSTLLWQGLAIGTNVSHIGAFDAAFNGNLEFAGPVPNGTPIVFNNAGYLQLAANTYHFAIDA